MKCSRIFVGLLFFNVAYYAHLAAVSIVYNFRIAQITKQPLEENKHKSHLAIILPFDQMQKKYSGVFQNFAGGLEAFIYGLESFYARADFSFAYVKETYEHVTTYTGMQADDLLFTFGYNVKQKRSRMTFSCLFGVPTHEIVALKHVPFGYSQVGLGGQLDGTINVGNGEQAFIYGGRYIYFVPRNAKDDLGNMYNYTIGQTVDLLAAYKKNWEVHGIEFGYTARFFFAAAVHPHFDDEVKKLNYIRSNFYTVYKYRFFIGEHPQRLLFNISYGFDHTPKHYGNKYIVTVWGSWNISF